MKLRSRPQAIEDFEFEAAEPDPQARRCGVAMAAIQVGHRPDVAGVLPIDLPYGRSPGRVTSRDPTFTARSYDHRASKITKATDGRCEALSAKFGNRASFEFARV